MVKYMMKRFNCYKNNTLTLLIVLLLAGLLPGNVHAETEEAKLPNGYIATADYRSGNAAKPAVLLLHGFMSTRNFLTVLNLTNALADEGYTVLAPNLSLGVDHRKASLACEAIHTHTIYDDIEEIDYWVKWLTRHGHQKIVLLGHSYGSLHGLVYTVEYKNPAVKKLIATSLVDVEHAIGEKFSRSQIKAAKDMVAKNDSGLRDYQLSYCKKYVSSPKAFLSYATWSKQRILNAISQSKIPVEVILGGNDSRMADNWPQLLKKNGVTLQVVEEANHFFHNEQEFDLLDSVLGALQSVN
jgi:pimeloyl-ACP methyl ester carboxylesterase